MKAIGISERQDLEKFVSLQAYYSLAGRDLEHETVSLLQDQKLALLTWSPLAGGALSGKYTRASRTEDGRRMKFDFPPIKVEKVYDIVDAVQKIAKKHDTSVPKIALAWQLHQPFVTSVIIGAKTGEQLADNLGATEIELDAEDLAAIDAVSKPEATYPSWMLRGTQSDRFPGGKRDWAAVRQANLLGALKNRVPTSVLHGSGCAHNHAAGHVICRFSLIARPRWPRGFYRRQNETAA